MITITPCPISPYEIDLVLGTSNETPLVHVVYLPPEAASFCEAERIFAALIARLPLLLELITDQPLRIALDPEWRHAKGTEAFLQLQKTISNFQERGVCIKLQTAA